MKVFSGSNIILLLGVLAALVVLVIVSEKIDGLQEELTQEKQTIRAFQSQLAVCSSDLKICRGLDAETGLSAARSATSLTDKWRLIQYFVLLLADYNSFYYPGNEGIGPDYYFWQNTEGYFGVQCKETENNICCQEGEFDYNSKKLKSVFREC